MGVFAFFGIAAALAKECMMPPDAPRFGAGFFVPEGIGVDSLEDEFDSVLSSSLTFSAGAGFAGAGFGLAGAGAGPGAGVFGTALRRSLRRT